jgi:uncharacterized protein DUF2846
MRFAKFFVAVNVLLVLVGCAATGPLYTEVASAIPPVPANKGRIYFFRPDTMLGAAVTADINLNGKVVGKSERASFFFVDENPGKCTVMTSTEIERQLTFTLDSGQTRYVRTSVSFGVMVGRINPELVAADEAKTEIAGLHYTGTALSKK